MRAKKNLLVIILITIWCGGLAATEFRSPLVVERGPLRYVFEEWEESDYNLKLWSAGFGRHCHKAFLSHGTSTYPLSTLFFNKSCFTLNEIFPNSCVDMNTQYYSPFLAVTQLRPRITYSEKGISLGARFAYPVYKNKGRVGLRLQIPFRKIEIEREDHGDTDTDPLDDFMTGEIVTRDGLTSLGASNPSTDVYARAIRMDFLQSLPYTAGNNPILQFDANGVPSVVGDTQVIWDAVTNPNNFDKRIAVVIHSPAGTVPSKPDRYLGIHMYPVTNSPVPLEALAADGGSSGENQFYFASGTDYTPLNMHPGGVCGNTTAQAKASQLWLTSVHDGRDNQPGFSTGSAKMWNAVDWVLQNYQDENVFEWLETHGNFQFATANKCGMGDIDLDLFYEHQFNDEATGEVMVGVRFPTGASDNYCCNPYRPHAGNGEHWEIKLGGMVAWQPLDWMNIKIDGRYVFVLRDEEKRMAAFKGACIKNIGPCTKADVSWEYFDGTIDFNLFHPKTDAISCVVGYEFYYKTEDNIDFKCRTLQSWLGKKLVDGEWVENNQTLDSKVAEKYTDSIAHKVRFETSFRISQYFELFCGGAYTFAGKNAPRDCDCFGGCVVTF